MIKASKKDFYIYTLMKEDFLTQEEFKKEKNIYEQVFEIIEAVTYKEYIKYFKKVYKNCCDTLLKQTEAIRNINDYYNCFDDNETFTVNEIKEQLGKRGLIFTYGFNGGSIFDE